MMPITASTPMYGAHRTAASGRIGMAMRIKPYVPNFSRMAARITEPTVGASVCASGSQVWKGNIGTLMAKPMNRPPKIHSWVLRAIDEPFWIRVGMSKVCPPLKYKARKLRIIKAEPNSVKRKNLIDAYWRVGPPHTPALKYIGGSPSPQQTKKKSRALR